MIICLLFSFAQVASTWGHPTPLFEPIQHQYSFFVFLSKTKYILIIVVEYNVCIVYYLSLLI